MSVNAALAAEYSAKAAAYARLWAPFLRPLVVPLLDSLPLASAGRVLDLGAGTGQLVDLIRERSPRCNLVLADRAEGMVRLAPDRARDFRVVADAQELGFADDAFDLAVLAFMLFHLPQPSAGLAEVRRVLRKGGVVGVTTWGDDPDVPGVAFWTEELDAAGAAPDPRHPSTRQQATMDTPQKLAALLRESGFSAIEVGSRRFEYAWAVEALLAVQLGCGMASRRIGSLPQDAANRCRYRVEERLRRLTAEELIYRPEVLWASARRA